MSRYLIIDQLPTHPKMVVQAYARTESKQKDCPVISLGHSKAVKLDALLALEIALANASIIGHLPNVKKIRERMLVSTDMKVTRRPSPGSAMAKLQVILTKQLLAKAQAYTTKLLPLLKLSKTASEEEISSLRGLERPSYVKAVLNGKAQYLVLRTFVNI